VGALRAIVSFLVLVWYGINEVWNTPDLVLGIALPSFYSIVAGLVAGLTSYLILKFLE
jgi:hypothetical protein